MKISDHAMYCDRYESDYYISDTKARLPIRWMSWESLLLVSPFKTIKFVCNCFDIVGKTNNKKRRVGIRGDPLGNSNVVHATALRRTD